MATILVRTRPTRSGRQLARALGIRCTKRNSDYRPRDGDVLLNWGSRVYPNPPVTGATVRWINHPAAVRTAVNKLHALQRLVEMGCYSVPAFTTNAEQAQEWLQDGDSVISRQWLNASGGRGMVLIRPGDPWVPGRMYARYFKGRQEFRVHVVDGEVIDFQQKRKRQEVPNDEIDYNIRTHSHGWVFCRSDVNLPANAYTEARAAVAALGLEFGAVDVKHNERNGQCAVLEVNTAPGLQGTTLDNYVNAIGRML